MKIKIHVGATVVSQSTGRTYRKTTPMITTAERDPNSGCVVFTTPLGTFYVMEEDEYEVLETRAA